jgi:aconitase A
MGAELGATTSVFPADERVRAFLDREGRGGDFVPVSGDGEMPLEAPLAEGDARQVELVKAPSIGTLPDFDELPADLRARVAIKVADNISTDEILLSSAVLLIPRDSASHYPRRPRQPVIAARR